MSVKLVMAVKSGVAKAALLVAACAAAACSPSPRTDDAPTERALAAPAQPRPNIIFLLTDDQRADALSVAGHSVLKTPNIDQLAEHGTRYTNAFTVQPICAPSRFAFLSGQYERTSGLGFNSPYEVSEQQWRKTYPALLREAGYHTGFIGKFGVQYYALEGTAADKFDYWRAHDGWLPFFPKDIEGNPATAIYEGANSDITTEIMGEYIREFLNTRPVDQPFNLSVSFSAPHNSLVSSMYPEGAAEDCDNYACRVMGYPANGNPRLASHPIYDALYRDADIQISPDTGRDPYRFIPEGVIDHDARQQWYAYNYDRALQPEHLIRYYQAISGVDAVIGQMMQQLESLGIADNTVIVFSSDHGLLNGEYGTGGKGLLYDLVAKVPLVVYDPRLDSAVEPRVSDDLVLSIDVPATMLSLASLSVPDSMQGRDLNADIPARQSVFLESLTVAEGNPFIEALRTEQWKYVRYLQPQGCPYTEAHLDFAGQQPVFEQLFHLPSDPDERRNLATDAEHAAVLEDFRQQIGARSAALTSQSREYKQAIGVPMRPEDGSYCW
ncbi:MAG: sulfatase-like hydrolase/transferase [Pseudomonadota bacterium]